MFLLKLFCNPYPNELIYSVLARYHFYSGNISFRDTNIELFGENYTLPSIDCVSSLESLCKNIGADYSAEQFIYNNSILPFYFPFVENHKKRLLMSMARFDGRNMFVYLGLAAGSVSKQNLLKFCPDCAREDYQKFGESYFHREHHLDGIILCPHHGTFIEEYQKSDSRVEYTRLRNDRIENSKGTACESNYSILLRRISRQALYLLENKVDFKDLKNSYEYFYNTKNLITIGCSIRQRELAKMFLKSYPTEFLENIGIKLDLSKDYCWLYKIGRDPASCYNPLKHILLILLFANSIQEFIREGRKGIEKVFKEVPYPCLNPVCDNYKRNVIRNVSVKSDSKSKKPIGIFECECGFIYARKGPDINSTDRFRIGRIICFGHVWQKKLKELNEIGYCYSRIAKEMKCDFKTVKKYIERREDGISVALIKPHKTDKYKNAIKECMLRYPKYNRTKIRNLMAKEYAYLYRNEREWLYANLPKKKIEVKQRKFIDWLKRDEELLIILKRIKKDLLIKNENKRISASMLMRKSGHEATLTHHKDKLIKCYKFLKNCSETVENFQIRRCENWIEYYDEKGIDFKPWRLMRDAGLRKEAYYKIEDKIKSPWGISRK